MPFLNNAGITAAGRVAVVDAPVTANGVLGAISFNANQAMVIDQTGGVADSVSGGLYFKAGALKCIVSEIALPGSQSYRDGLAFSPNGFLYINTHAAGGFLRSRVADGQQWIGVRNRWRGGPVGRLFQ